MNRLHSGLTLTVVDALPKPGCKLSDRVDRVELNRVTVIEQEQPRDDPSDALLPADEVVIARESDAYAAATLVILRFNK